MTAPTLGELVDKIVRARLLGVNVHAPARIVSYDHASQSCSAEPTVAQRIIVEADSVVPEYMPILNGVPVMFPGSGKNAHTWKLKPGDYVLLAFTQRSNAKWLKVGGKVDPGDSRTHNHNDAVAIPGLRPFGDLGATSISDDATVDTFEGEWRIGSSLAADPAVRVTDIAKVIAGLNAAIATLTTAGILSTALEAAIAAAQPAGPTPDPQTVLTLGALKATLLVDPSAGALQALLEALETLGFPSGSPRVKLE